MSATDIALMNIASKADMVRRDAEGTARYVRVLVGLPEFETRAEEAVGAAETALTEALLAVKLAKAELIKKRVTISNGD
jgi:hypothetical protein